MFDDSQWRVVDVPHDWSVEGGFAKDNSTGKAGGFLLAGVGWYRKDFSLGRDVARKRVFVDFDGVMANSDVWINGQHLGHRPNGYVSFEYELTPFVHAGENVLAVRCDNSLQPASRWYSGAGIYRHVRLVITNPLHVEHWGTFVSTPTVSADHAVVKVENRVVNEGVGAANIAVRTTIVDPAGKAVASQIASGQQIAA
jgi:beta-galactosidase